MLHEPADSLITQAQYAEQIGVSRQYVNKLVQQGKIPAVGPNKLIDPDEADRAREQSADPAFGGGSEAVQASDDVVAYRRARAEREQQQAELIRLRVQEQAGELTRKDDVEREAFEVARMLRDRIIAVAGQVVGEVMAAADEREAKSILETALRGALENAADDVGRGLDDLSD